tara:strand:+ start:254 stop:463 length:210 start_codon:yes stop_codon:yes gene_type:complete
MLNIVSAKLGGLAKSVGPSKLGGLAKSIKRKKPLIGKQKKIDANKDGKISGEDFKMLRKKQTLMSRRGY